ncbi:MAG: hypothetical protein WCF12_03770 [Propionicimonas sp.]
MFGARRPQVSRTPASGGIRGAMVALCACLVATTAVVLTAAPAAAVGSTQVADGPRPTEVLAASGDDLVALGGGRVRTSDDGGQTWDDWESSLALQPTTAAVYVADGDAVWVVDRTVYTLDLAAGSLVHSDLAERPLAATSTHVLWGSSPYWLTSRTVPGDDTQLSVDSDLSLPSSSQWYLRPNWVLTQHAILKTTGYASSQNAKRTSYLDIDPINVDGSFGPAPFRVKGWVPYVGVVGTPVAPVIEYVVHSGATVKYCTRPWGGLTKVTCKKMVSASSSVTTAAVTASRYGDVIGFSNRGVPYLWLPVTGTSVKVRAAAGTSAFTGIGDPTAPLLRTTDGLQGTTYHVAVDGTVSKAFDDFIGPVPPTSLDLSATRLVGMDGRARQQGWRRAVSAADIGSEHLLPGDTRAVQTSAGRMVVQTAGGLTFYDNDELVSTAKRVTTLHDISGPYTWVTESGKSTVIQPSGARAGTRVAALFGSRVVEWNASHTGGTIRDLATNLVRNLPGPSAGYVYDAAFLWGDKVALGSHSGISQVVEVFEVGGTGPVATATDAVPVAMGDGVVALYDFATSSYKLWETSKDFDPGRKGAESLPEADTETGPSFDGGTSLAYSTGDELRILDLRVYNGADLAADSAPRVLGIVAPTSYDVDGPDWRPQLDLTKAVKAGTIEISDASGTVVATVDTPAAPDGSIRGVAWNGIPDTPGGGDPLVPNGVYRWVYKAEASDGSGAVVSVDGGANPGGALTVQTTAMTAGTQTIVGKAAVGSTLTVKGTWAPSGLTLTHRWLRGTTVVGTSASYVVDKGDVGQTIFVEVSGTNRRNAGLTKASAATRTVVLGTLVAPTPVLTSGVPKVDVPVTADAGAWTPATADLAYAWYRVSSSGRSTLIAGALASLYTPGAADVGFRLKVAVTGTQEGYAPLTKTSAASARVVA